MTLDIISIIRASDVQKKFNCPIKFFFNYLVVIKSIKFHMKNNYAKSYNYSLREAAKKVQSTSDHTTKREGGGVKGRTTKEIKYIFFEALKKCT